MSDAQGQSADDSLYSHRVEDKFVIKKSDMDVIVSEIEDRLKPDYVGKDVDYTLINSAYLDSSDFKFLKQDLSQDKLKYKLRIRTYAPNGKWDEEKFAEVKYKDGDTKKKARIKIDQFTLIEILAGNQIPNKTQKLNRDMSTSDYESAVSLIEQCSEGGLQPALKVTYKRLAYASDEVRTTIDTKIKVDDCALSRNFDADTLRSSGVWAGMKEVAMKYDSNKAVWEIKYTEGSDMPSWLDKLANDYKIGEPGFSKYLYGLFQVMK